MIVPCSAGSVGVPIVAREAVVAFPRRAARRRAEEVLRDSTHATNLMIMSLGHEASISKAILFASRDDNSFSEELRRCVWSVVMGTCESFEESLHALGSRWARFSAELKATVNAMVTASCESTEDGRRRALDRANNAMIMGAKRRIEEYALSLSMPSMVMFGLGILLPLMVGSFLPMLSWDLWSFDGVEAAATGDSSQADILQTVFLMNILFPALAFLVASNAVAHHPLDTEDKAAAASARVAPLLAAASASISGAAASIWLLEGHLMTIAILLSATVPLGLSMALEGLRLGAGGKGDGPGLEDALFVTGARMLEGENFEAALERAASDLDGRSAATVRALSFRSNIAGQDFDAAVEERSAESGSSNALDAFKVVREAGAKDETAAGLLAMDLAAYLKDLHDLEDTLKGRLKPTISMMRMTAYLLGPIVMGVTYGIYISMGSVIGSVQGGIDPDLFLMVLGVFLAETGVIVSYFVWGVEGKGRRSELLFSAGTCMVGSEIVFAATSFFASA